MVQPWWVAPPLGLSALLLGVFRRKGNRRSKKDEEAARDDSGLSFSCERVCTSDMLLKRLGTLAKARQGPAARGAPALTVQPRHAWLAQEPTPNTCVTVCGVSSACKAPCAARHFGCRLHRLAHAGRQFVHSAGFPCRLFALTRRAPRAYRCSHGCMHRGVPARGVPEHAPGTVASPLVEPPAGGSLRAAAAADAALTPDVTLSPPCAQVPAWNDACLKRCTLECHRGRT
jgi:hypothetical protein